MFSILNQSDNFRILSFIVILCFFSGCMNSNKGRTELKNMSQQIEEFKYTNDLIKESSPYLLQHAHNPVNWVAWNEESLRKAKEEDKMILISIGYSACHWCHVMEKESFEDEHIARFMNEHFICIKVDREERPDIDQIYMNAVQLITGSGGWPLNCFALPDGRPFYGGTYFPPKNWLYLLQNIQKEFANEREKMNEYADQLTKGVRSSELLKLNNNQSDYDSILSETIEAWKQLFDNVHGGPNRAPKFPIPNNYEFLLDYAIVSGDELVLSHVELSLDKIASGGIYDHIDGGFARYSTDGEWHIPHFEKMLYDNAQLASLYAKAYRYFKKETYLNTLNGTLNFVKNFLTSEKGFFYSALDADSEGEEGKYYTFTKEELDSLGAFNHPKMKQYFSLIPSMEWEGKYVLHRTISEEEFKDEFKDEKEYEFFLEELNSLKGRMKKLRKSRVLPGLDDKSLTSWNALMISGYCEAYKATNNKDHLNAALKNASSIWENQHVGEGKLLHSYKEGKSTINGFLEDYAHTARSFIDLYEVTFDDSWLEKAEVITQYTFDHFFDEESQMFFFTSDEQNDLIARKMDVNDNVIPSSNSVMANVLNDLSLYLDKDKWGEISDQMLKNISPYIVNYGSGYSNWSSLMLKHFYPSYEVAICGKDVKDVYQKMNKKYLPNVLFVGSETESSLALLENKYVDGKTMIYVCVNKSCQLPVEKTEEAIKQIVY